MNSLTPPAPRPDLPTSAAQAQPTLGAWNRFWFTPADPTVLALIRFCCGAIALYTVFFYTWDLQEFFGKDAWWDLESRGTFMREGPVLPPSLGWDKPTILDQDTLTEEQKQYVKEYQEKFAAIPPPPFPTSKEEADNIDAYIRFWGTDPRLILTKGTPVWSVWFHVTDPGAMMAIHISFLLIFFCLTIGFCTRITSVLAWFAYLNYINRSPIMLFGVDTMTVIVMMYLMIAPCGAVFSVDRLIAGWWAVNGARVRARWSAFWERLRGRPQTINPEEVALGTPLPARPEPSVAANVAIRLLQIHLCIIYAAAGFSKLQGSAWWQGTAVWLTLANYEFAPMQYPLYQDLLKTITKHRMLMEVLLNAATFFTLFFEISYAFLIWRPSTRWLVLGMALTLHGFIGVFMGLKTFSLMMLTMNLAFLPPYAVLWLVKPLERLRFGGPPAPEAAVLLATPTSIRAAKEPVPASTGPSKNFRRKR